MISIEDIEDKINKYNISLLGQLRFDKNEKLELAKYAKCQIPKINNTNPDIRLAAALVIIAKQIYDQGNFWGKLSEALHIDIPQNKTVIIGKIFLKTIKKYNLFEIEKHKKNNEYVQNILAHCFVPTNYLDNFYEFLFSFYDRNLNRCIPENIDDDIQDLKNYMKKMQNTQDEDLRFDVSRNHAAVSYKLIKSTQTVIAEGKSIINDILLHYLELIDDYFYNNSTTGMSNYPRLINWCENKFEKLTSRKLSNYRNIPRFRNSTPFIGYSITNNKVYIVIPERKFSEDTYDAIIKVKKDNEDYCARRLELCQAYGCIKSDDVEFIEIDGNDIFSEFKIFCNEKLLKTIDKNFFRIFNNIKNPHNNLCIDYYEVEEFNEVETCILTQPDKTVELSNAVLLFKDINNRKFNTYIFNMKQNTTVLIDEIPFDINSSDNRYEIYKLFFNSPNNFKMKTEKGKDIICSYSHPKIYFKNQKELLEKNPFILCSNNRPINLKDSAEIKKLSSDYEYAAIDLNNHIDKQIDEYIVQLDIPGQQRINICHYLLIDDLDLKTDKTLYLFDSRAIITQNTHHYIEAENARIIGNISEDITEINYEYKIEDDFIVKFDIELSNKNYKIEIPLQVFQYSFDNKKWFYLKKDYIYNHELRNYFYVKIPGISEATLYMSNDCYYPIYSKNRGNYLEFDIHEITEKVNETDCFKDDLNIEFEYYDKKSYKRIISTIINQIYIKTFKFDFDKSNLGVYIDTEFYTEKYKFGVDIRNVETDEVLNVNLQVGKNYIKELDSQGIYDITKYIEKKNLFGKTFDDKKIIEVLKRQTPTKVLFLPSNCQIVIEDLHYENRRYSLNYNYQIAKGRAFPNYYWGVLYPLQKPVIFDFVNNDNNKIYFKLSNQIEFCYDTETKSLIPSDAPYLHKNYSRYLFLDYDNSYFNVTIKENRKDY